MTGASIGLAGVSCGGMFSIWDAPGVNAARSFLGGRAAVNKAHWTCCSSEMQKGFCRRAIEAFLPMHISLSFPFLGP